MVWRCLPIYIEDTLKIVKDGGTEVLERNKCASVQIQKRDINEINTHTITINLCKIKSRKSEEQIRNAEIFFYDLIRIA